MQNNYEEELKVALNAVKKACLICQLVFNNLSREDSVIKSDNSPVTIADYGSQAVINRLIRKEFPLDSIVGEEDANDLKDNPHLRLKVLNLVNEVIDDHICEKELVDSIDEGRAEGGTSRFWTLDPIDGTKGFLRGGQYAVCLALIENGDVKVGVLGTPNLPLLLSDPLGPKTCLFYAVKDQGAFQISSESSEPQRIHCNPSIINLTCVESVESGHSSHDSTKKIAHHLNLTHPSLRMDSQCKYACIGRGDASIYLRIPVSETYEEKIWDHASGALIVSEAGGIVTDVYGKKLDFTLGRTLKANKGIIACHPDIHSKVLKAAITVLKRTI